MQNKEFYIQNDGIRLHAKLDFPIEEAASYPLLILIHGFTGHMEEPHIIGIARAINEIGFATLRAEMYGHGQSDGVFRDHTLFKWLTNIMAVIDYAKRLDFVTDICLGGHSQGGLLTMLAAAMERDTLKAILPLSPAWMIPEKARKGDLLGISFDPLHIPQELRLENGLSLDGNYLRAAQMLDPEYAIRTYTGPVLLIHGDQDTTVPVSYSYKATRLYKNAKLVIIPGDTHCYDHHLDLVTDAVKEFLKSL